MNAHTHICGPSEPGPLKRGENPKWLNRTT
jgi:hypothetical protein